MSMPALHVRMPLERGIHAVVQFRQLARIFAEQMRPEFAQPGAHAFRISRQIKRPERTHLPVAHQARIRFHPDDRAVKDRHRFATRPFVSGLVER